MSPSIPDDRSLIFQQLKPPCVTLSKAALSLNGANPDVEEVALALANVKTCLQHVNVTIGPLDPKLAEFAFFPISQVLKSSAKASIRCLELALQCLAILISEGWKSLVPGDLAMQIAILCTLLAENEPKALLSGSSTPELQASAFSCLHSLFEALTGTSEAERIFANESNIPQWGSTISTILDVAEVESSPECHIAAIAALKSLVICAGPFDINAAFLPGIVSKLTKILTPSTKRREPPKVLVLSLSILCHLFATLLSGDNRVDLTTQNQSSELKSRKGKKSRIINEEWLKMASKQLQPAIVTVCRLVSHSRDDVRAELARFCFVILDQCGNVLEVSAPQVLETLLKLLSTEELIPTRDRLVGLVRANVQLAERLQNAAHDSIKRLPTMVQSSNDQANVQGIAQIRTTYGILQDSDCDTRQLEGAMAASLRDSVFSLLQTPKTGTRISHAMLPVQSLELTLSGHIMQSQQYDSGIVKHRGQEGTLTEIKNLATQIGCSRTSASFSQDNLRSLRHSEGDMQLASFWLLVEYLSSRTSAAMHTNDLAHLGNEDIFPVLLEDLYAFSIDVLRDSLEEPPDSRVQSLALRTLGLYARAAGTDFRGELIDSLYPVLHTLATPDVQLQQNSIATLNIFTAACKYPSTQQMIAENVDYLTNAIALKLNAFDVSPQGPQVLLMMIRLAGPSVLPYLEDTIDSIFAALEDYHGYSLLVEMLFKVLKVVVDEGVKTPQLSIEDGMKSTTAIDQAYEWRPTSFTALTEFLRDRTQGDMESAVAEEENHPQRPWKDPSKSALREDDPDFDDDGGDHDEDLERGLQETDQPPPSPKIYKLILRVTELTQHFLPSASASLRSSLLSLILRTTPALAKHENSFLPLINTIWPEVTARLDDTEPSVVAAALDVINSLCEHAGDFMRSRILQLWPVYGSIHARITKELAQAVSVSHDIRAKHTPSTAETQSVRAIKEAISRMGHPRADYVDRSSGLIWASLVGAVTAAVKFVNIPPEIFDEALVMLDPVFEDSHVLQALQKHNADAVWLVEVRRGTVQPPSLLQAGVESRWKLVPVGRGGS